MAQKPSFLKRITTASTVAFAAAAIVGTGSTAFGAALTNRTTAGTPATLNDGANLDQDAAAANLAFANGSALTLGGAHDVATGAAPKNIVALYLGANNGQTFTVTNSVTIGSVAGTAAQIINFDIAANQTLTFTGTGVTAVDAAAAKAGNPLNAAAFGDAGKGIANNIYTGLGKVNFANPSTLEFNLTNLTTEATPLVLGANATIDNGGNGTLNITKGFIQVSDKSFATIKAIKVEAGNGIIFNSTETAAGVLNLQAAANNVITLAGDAKLILKSKAGAGNAVSFKAVTGTLGATGGDNNGVIVFDASGAGANASLTSNKAGTAVAVVGTNDATRAQGFIVKGNGVADTTIDGEVYAKAVELQGGKVIFGQIVNVGANGTTNFTTAGSQATISKSSNLGAVTFGAFAGNTLTLTSAEANTTLTGNFTGDATAANFPTLLFAGANTSALAAADKTQPVVKNFKAIENTVAQAVTLGAGTYTTDLNISNANGSFILADGFELTGNVNATKGANALAAGKLTAQGNATISGDIGFNATAGKGQTPLGDITVADVADKTLTLGGANIIGAGNINYGANVGGIVKLTNTTAPNIRVEYNLSLAADNKGVFDASSLTNKQTLTISGSIGTFDAAVAPATIDTASKSLEQLTIGEGNLVLSAGDAAINSLVMGDNSTVTLAHNTYKIVTTNSGGNGTVVISPDVADPNNGTTLASGTKLGDNGSSLKEIKFKLTGVTQGGTDVTLNVGQNVNLYATNITTDTNNKGSFSFTSGGTSIVGGQVGTAASKLNTVAITNGTTVQFKNSVFFAGATTIDATSTLQIGGAYQADSIGGAAADQGTVEFVNTTPITLNTTNAGNAISTIKVSGSDNVTLTKEFGAKNIAFGKNSPRVALSLAATDKIQGVTITSAAGGIGNAPVVVTSLAGGDSIDAGQAVGDANNIVSIGLGGDIAFTVNEGTNFFGAILPVTDAQGTVNLNAANSGQVYGLGQLNQRLKLVNITENTTNFGSAYVSEKLTINDGKAFTTGGQGTKLDAPVVLGNASGVNSHLIVAAGTNFSDNFTVDGAAANQGTATFKGNAFINGIGNTKPILLAEFTGPAGSDAFLNGNINAQQIQFNGYDLIVLKNAALNGVSNVNGQLILGTNTLTFNGNSSWGTNTNIFTTLKNGTLGSINIESGKVTAAGNILADVTISDQDTLGAINEKYLLINGGINLVLPNGTSVTLDPESDINSNQRFAKYSIIQNSDDRNYYVTRSNNATAVILDQITSNAAVSGIPGIRENITALTNPQNTGAAQQFVTNIGNLNVADSTQATVAVITDVDALIDNVIDNTTEHFSSIIGNRVEVARYAQLPVGAPEGVLARPEGGVVGAADDADDNVSYGAWLKPVYTDATQKGIKGTPGYNAKTTGGIFGFDTMANDNLMVGAAIGINQTKIKYKNYKSGDKSTVNGFLVSLYGAQQLVDNFFVQGGATFNLSQIKTKSKRYTADTTNGQKIAETATSNYDNMTFGGNVMFGYDAKLMDGVLLTPMAGISYLKSGDESYKETGTQLQNKQVASKFSDKTDVIVGAKVLGDVMNLSGFAFYPEAHAFVTHKVSGKYAKTQAKLDGQVDFMTGLPDKSAKTSYNLGLSIAARPGPQMEYGIGYDANLASKYVAHTGTLKVRVNF